MNESSQNDPSSAYSPRRNKKRHFRSNDSEDKNQDQESRIRKRGKLEMLISYFVDGTDGVKSFRQLQYSKRMIHPTSNSHLRRRPSARARFTHHQIVEFCIFNHVSYVLSKRPNLIHNQLITKNFDPAKFNYQDYFVRNLHDISVARDVSYLPEEYYDAERELQQLNRDNRNLMPEYRNLCETVTKRVEIIDSDYEYQPPHYHEIYCKGYSLMSEDERTMKPLHQKCAYPAFHCVQRSRTLTFVRRRWENECWEPYTREIASGCDCMWPVTNLGEINHHY